MCKKTLGEKDAADYIGMSRSYLRQDRMYGTRKNRTTGPQYIKIGRNIRYPIKYLDEWIAKHTIAAKEVIYRDSKNINT